MGSALESALLPPPPPQPADWEDLQGDKEPAVRRGGRAKSLRCLGIRGFQMSQTRDDQNEQTTSNTAQTQAQQPKTNVGPASANEPASSQTTDRKKQANRENSKHSTGPKTGAGKTWIRYNALKHGLYASDVVIRQGDGKENQEEFDILLEGLRRAWNPRDVMQEVQVRTIAEAEWRLRRAARAEVGEIRRRTDSYYARQSLDFWDDGLVDGAFWSKETSKEGARNTIFSVDSKLNLLAAVRKDLEERGCVGDEVQKTLDSAYGKDHILATRCHRLSRLVQYQQVDEGRSSSPDTEEGGHAVGDGEGLDEEKNALLHFIDSLVVGLKQYLSSLEQAEALEHQATLLACNLPSREFVDKLIRYETALANQKDRAVKLLLKLQGK